MPRLKLIPLVCLFCMQVFALGVGSRISQYAHTAWRIQDGFFSSSPVSIAQTTDGYIWIGTRSGMMRFDGVRFVPWVPPNGEHLRSLTISSLLGARDGSLWIGTDGSGLWHWDNQRLTRIPQSGASRINAIIEDDNGSIWITRSKQLDGAGPVCEAKGGKFHCFGSLDGIPPAWGYGLAKDREGNLWIGSDMSLVKWRSDSSNVYAPEALKANANSALVQGVAVSPEGSAWIGVLRPGPGRGLQQFSHNAWKPFVSEDWDSSSAGIWSLLLDRRNTLWIGTTTQGLYRINDGKVDHFGSAEGLTGDTVARIFEDHEGNLWVATVKGLDCFRDFKMTTFSQREGLSGPDFETLLASRDGAIWVGGGGGLDKIQNGKIASLRTGKELPGTLVTSIMEDHAGRFWMGIDQTLSILKDGKLTQIKRPDGRPFGYVVSLAEDTENNVWAEISGATRELIEVQDLQVKQILPAPHMPTARKLAADPKGGIWLGLANGDMARYRQGKLERFRFPHKVDSFVNDIGVESDGSVLGATGFGLIGWRDGKQRLMTVVNGLPCDSINSFVRDGRGALWLWTQCGLVQISDEEVQKWWERSDAVLQTRLFGSDDGAQPGLAALRQAVRSADGRLWFVNTYVVQTIDPEHLATNGIPPPVHIEEAIANRRTYSPTDSLRFPALTRDLAIRYTALSFVAPQKVRFRYILEGQDKEWQEAGTRREAFYTNLAPATYRFRVIACNNDGVWNETGATWSFYIAPAYYQTLWFKVLCIAFALAISGTLYRLRLGQATAHLQARLGERLAERERIARELHDTLLQSFSGLVLRFAAALKKMPPTEPSRELIEKALDRADEVLLEGQLRVRNLRLEATATKDLAESLLDCGEELTQDSGVTFKLAVVGKCRPLDPAAFDEAYKIGREALINAFSHSRASTVEVEITYDRANLRLRVRDNGIGVDPNILKDGRAGHWGLAGIRERAKTIDALLSIWSSLGAGTEIDLTIPTKVAYSRGPKVSSWLRLKRTFGGGRAK